MEVKKIILVFYEDRFPESGFEFARQLRTEGGLSLTGVLLPGGGPRREAEDEHIARFKWLCGQYRIDCSVCTDPDTPGLAGIARESRSADLLIAETGQFGKEGKSWRGLSPEDFLRASECPVLLVPHRIYHPKHILLSYDGSASSVSAIGQFATLFPDLCKRESTLIYEGRGSESPDKTAIEELSVRHFPSLNFLRLDPEDAECFQSWLRNIADPLVVAGSFDAEGISPLFRRGFIVDLIRQNHLLVFLARR